MLEAIGDSWSVQDLIIHKDSPEMSTYVAGVNDQWDIVAGVTFTNDVMVAYRTVGVRSYPGIISKVGVMQGRVVRNEHVVVRAIELECPRDFTGPERRAVSKLA